MRIKHLIIAVYLLLAGCSLTSEKIKEPILLDREPVIRQRYEYESVGISLPYTIEDQAPDSINVRLTLRSDPSLTILENDFPAGSEIELFVPPDQLDTLARENLLIVTPAGDGFEQREIFFSAGRLPVIDLETILIRQLPYSITGWLINRRDQAPVAGIDIELLARSKNLNYGTTVSDSLGFFRLELRAAHIQGNDFNLRVIGGGEYPDMVIPVEFIDRECRLKILLGLSLAAEQEGVTCRITNPATTFRTGPENGADIQFFLAAGDIIVITKVAGNRYYGFVEVPVADTHEIQRVFGWVNEEDILRQP